VTTIRLHPLSLGMALAGCPLMVSQAADFTVTSNADSGPGSLRDVIAEANGAAGAPHNIYFDLPPATTITLTSGQLLISQSMTLHGPGREDLIVSGNNNSRLFRVEGSGLLEATISGMTLTEGRVESSTYGESGGAILATGGDVSLTVQNTLITENQTVANDGGAIGLVLGASLSCIDSVVSSNTAGSSGSGGAFSGLGSMNLNQCHLLDNEASVGGAIMNFDRHLNVQQSTISGNRGHVSGGGLYLVGTAQIYAGSSPATAEIEGSTLTNNTSGGGGGCIYGNFAEIEIRDSLISGCQSDLNGAGIRLIGLNYPFTDYSLLYMRNTDVLDNHAYGYGGGIAVSESNVDLADLTVAENSAMGTGGALFFDQQTRFELSNVDIDDNEALDGSAGIVSFSNRADSRLEFVRVTNNRSGQPVVRFLDGDTLTIESSLFANNESWRSPGLYFGNQTADLVNSTIAGNEATLPLLTAGSSGVTISQGNVMMSNNTIAFNQMVDERPAVLLTFGTTVTMDSNLIALNFDASENGENSQISRAPFTTTLNGRHNLVGAGEPDLFNGTNENNLIIADPGIQPLAFSGGLSDTIALNLDSPARNAGINPLNLDFDQRGPGFPRVFGPSPDIGAFEIGSADLPDSIFADRFAQ
jgi:hypothetical protein